MKLFLATYVDISGRSHCLKYGRWHPSVLPCNKYDYHHMGPTSQQSQLAHVLEMAISWLRVLDFKFVQFHHTGECRRRRARFLHPTRRLLLHLAINLGLVSMSHVQCQDQRRQGSVLNMME